MLYVSKVEKCIAYTKVCKRFKMSNIMYITKLSSILNFPDLLHIFVKNII
jgi:hypothetical protein